MADDFLPHSVYYMHPQLIQLIKDELNVKELCMVASEDSLVTYRIRPNPRLLGPRFGKDYPKVAAAIEAVNAVPAPEPLFLSVGTINHILHKQLAFLDAQPDVDAAWKADVIVNTALNCLGVMSYEDINDLWLKIYRGDYVHG